MIPVWQKKFPKLLTEGSTRMLDVNKDGILDVVMGFGTGADGYNIPDFVCDIYFDGQKPCLGKNYTLIVSVVGGFFQCPH